MFLSENPAPVARWSIVHDSSAELYFGIPPTAILTRTPRGHFKVYESHMCNRLFRELNRIARDGERVVGMICEPLGALDRSSVRALNVYLSVMGGIRGMHKYDWREFQRDLALRWVR